MVAEGFVFIMQMRVYCGAFRKYLRRSVVGQMMHAAEHLPSGGSNKQGKNKKHI